MMSLEVLVSKIAPRTPRPPLKEKLAVLVEELTRGLSKLMVTLVSPAEPTALRTCGLALEPESGKASKSAGRVIALLVLKTKRSMNIPASRVPILRIKGVPAATWAGETV